MKQLYIALEFKIISDSDFHLLLLYAFIILVAAVLSFIYALNRKEKLRIVSFFVNSLPPAVMLLCGILFPELAKTLFFAGISFVFFLALTALTPKETNLDRADIKSLLWLWFILFFVISHFALKEKYEEIYQRFTSDRTYKNTENRLRKKVEEILERDYKAYVWLEDDRMYVATRTNGNKVYVEVIYRDSAVIRMRQKLFIKALLPADTNTWLSNLIALDLFWTPT